MLKERMQILMTSEQRRRLEAEAKRRGTSVASLVREAVDLRFGAVTPDDRLRVVADIGAMHGRFLSPEELDRLAEVERDRQLDAILSERRR